MEKEIVPKNKGTRQLFQNPILEKLSRTHIAVPLTIFSLFSGALLTWSITHTSLSAGTTIGLFALGMVVFSWVEYVVHRYVFHMKPYTAVRAKFQYTVHGIHHEYPKDKDRLAMPPLLSVTISTILLLLFRVVMGDFAFAACEFRRDMSRQSRIDRIGSLHTPRVPRQANDPIVPDASTGGLPTTSEGSGCRAQLSILMPLWRMISP